MLSCQVPCMNKRSSYKEFLYLAMYDSSKFCLLLINSNHTFSSIFLWRCKSPMILGFVYCVCVCMYVCVCVFILFHLLVSSGCTTSVIYVRSSDQRSFVVSIFWVLLPSSFISISESILFHLQRRKLQPFSYWRENDMI